MTRRAERSPAQARRQLWLVSGVLFLAMVGFGLTLPALPYFVERMALGLTPSDERVAFHVGALTSAYALSQVLLGPLLGGLSDRFGRRPFVTGGLIVFAVSQIVFGVAANLLVLYSARLAAGAGAAAMLTAANALVADHLPPEERARGLAWTGTATSLGVVVGPVMSGVLSRTQMHGHRMVGGAMLDGFSIPFLVAGALALGASVPAVLLSDANRVESRRSRPEGEERSLMIPLVLTGLAYLVLASFEATFALYGQDVLSLDIRQVGVGFAICGGVMGLQGVLVGLAGSRVTRSAQVASGFIGLGLGTALLGTTTSVPPALASIGLLALGMALIVPNLAAAIAARRPFATGSALGLQNTWGGLGRVAGPVAGALLYAVSPRLPFWLLGLAAIIIGASVVTGKRTPPARPGAEPG